MKSRFTYDTPPLIFGRARLYRDHVELTGWRFWRRSRRKIQIKEILQIDVLNEDIVLFWLTNGRTIRMRVSEPERWKSAIEARQDPPPRQDCSSQNSP